MKTHETHNIFNILFSDENIHKNSYKFFSLKTTVSLFLKAECVCVSLCLFLATRLHFPLPLEGDLRGGCSWTAAPGAAGAGATGWLADWATAASSNAAAAAKIDRPLTEYRSPPSSVPIVYKGALSFRSIVDGFGTSPSPRLARPGWPGCDRPLPGFGQLMTSPISCFCRLGYSLLVFTPSFIIILFFPRLVVLLFRCI